MDKINFNLPNNQLVHYGVSRVLVNFNNKIEPWDGVVRITESNTSQTGEYIYLDGERVNVIHPKNHKDYSIECYTYPSLIESALGYITTDFGGLLSGGPKRTIDLSWVTNISDNTGASYECINFLYNVMVNEPAMVNTTVGSTIEPNLFKIDLNVLPTHIKGYPSQYKITIDGRIAPENVITLLKDILYGDGENKPEWISPQRLMGMISSTNTYDVGPETKNAGVYTLIDGVSFEGSTAVGTYKITKQSTLVESTTKGLYTKG